MKKTQFRGLITLLMIMVTVPLALVHAQSPYFQAVTSLNPVGYWPMHEAEAAAHGDVETNYGSAGPLANGFYGDWVAPVAIIHNFSPGAIAGDPDPCVSFNYIYTNASGAQGSRTNCLIIPHTSSAATLIPPFTVECWYVFTNNLTSGKQSDIWSTVNANGTEPGLNGVSTYSGIRLFFNNNLSIYTYNNNGGVESPNSAVTIPFNNGVWHHLVTTDDGTNISVYLDGTLTISNWPNSTYAPNAWDPIEIDTGKGFTRDASGLMDEFAIYTNALSYSDITNHYYTAQNPAPPVPYKTLVLNDNPTIYYRMDSPSYIAPVLTSWPALTNYGSVAVNGVYTPGVTPAAAAGPNNGSSFAPGFAGGTNAMPGNGMSSFADAGAAAAYNPTKTNAFSISAWFQGTPADSRTQTIVGHGGATSWGLVMATTGHLQCQLGTNTGSALTSAGLYNDGNWHHVVEVYAPASVPTVQGTNALYVDGLLDSTVATVSTNGILPGTNLDVMIGTDPAFTNNPVALGRQFEGNICEVTLFASALTSSQILNLYNAGEMPPYITIQPVSAAANQSSAFTNTAAARGALPLAYQWYTNGVALAGQTNASLVLNPVESGSAGTYYVVVTNTYGSVTSAPASLAVNSSPSLLAQYPVTYTSPFTVYAGANPAFSVVASGAEPLIYFWTTNGVFDGAATNSSLVISNVQVGNISASCIVSNFVGSVTSIVWLASVIADPPNPAYGGLAPYPQAVLALNPIGYWRLNEQDDGLGDGNPNVVAQDYVSGNNGLYTNVNLGLPGYSALDTDGETSMEVGNFASSFSLASWIGSNIDFSTPSGGNGEFSVQTWVSLTKNSSTQSPQGMGIVCKGPPNSGEEFALDTSAGGPFRFYVRNAAGTEYIAAAASNPALNTFYHVAGVCDEARGTISLYINGILSGQTSIPVGSGIVSGNAVPMTIGARTPGQAAISSQCFGYLNDVAVFNYPLSSNQVLNEYLSSGLAPFFTVVPTNSVNIASGSNLVVTAMAEGTLPVSYQWYDTNNTAIQGQTNATLTLNNVAAGDTYYLQVTNIYGATNSPLVTVGVYTGPLIASFLPVPYTNLFTLYAGSSPNFSVQAVNLQNGQPLAYQWYTNGAGMTGQTGTNISISSVSLGTLNCYCVASNLLGATTSFVWTASVVTPPSPPYPQAVLSLRPIGYWRLDEPDDGAGNGDAGVIAHDYVAGNDGICTNVSLGSGPTYSSSDPDFMSAEFGSTVFVNSDAYGIAGIDFSGTNTSKSFSVEAWVNGYTQTKDAGIVTKGYGGGGEQFDLDTGSDGGTPSHAFRFLVRDASGGSHAVNSSVQPGVTWHHLVGVCNEANSNLTFYIDGQPVGASTIAPGSGILAGTSLMSIGSRFSSQAAQATNVYDNQFVGYITDVAVFNYALNATEVSNEYNGIITVLVNTNPTNIVTSVSGNQLTLSWPADHTGWELQAQTNGLGAGLGANWVPVTGSTTVNQLVVPMNPANGTVFYRLVYPPQ